LQPLGWYTKGHAASFSIDLQQDKSIEGEMPCGTAGPDEFSRLVTVKVNVRTTEII